MYKTYFFAGEIVYIRCGSDFECNLPNISDLIILLAKCVEYDDESRKLAEYDERTEKWNIYKGRTKNYIVKKTNNFLADFAIVKADEDMKPTVSKRQLNYLIKSSSREKKCISCYAAVILYIIFTYIFKNSENHEHEIREVRLSEYIFPYIDLLDKYYEEYPDDELAYFLRECYATLNNNLREKNLMDLPIISKRDFPPIHRRSVKNDQE